MSETTLSETTKVAIQASTATSTSTPTSTAIQPVAAAVVPRVVISGLDATVTFSLSRDLLLACEDQANCMGLTLADYLQGVLNEILHNYLGM